MLADAVPWVATWKAEMRRRDGARVKHTPEDMRAFSRASKKRRKAGVVVKPAVRLIMSKRQSFHLRGFLPCRRAPRQSDQAKTAAQSEGAGCPSRSPERGLAEGCA